jgi:hypothetical protein
MVPITTRRRSYSRPPRPSASLCLAGGRALRSIAGRPVRARCVLILSLPREIHDHDSEAYLTGVFSLTQNSKPKTQHCFPSFASLRFTLLNPLLLLFNRGSNQKPCHPRHPCQKDKPCPANQDLMPQASSNTSWPGELNGGSFSETTRTTSLSWKDSPTSSKKPKRNAMPGP